MHTIKRMVWMAKPWWRELAVTILALVAASFLSLVTPEAVRRLTALLGTPENLTYGTILTYVLIMSARICCAVYVDFYRCGRRMSRRGALSPI